MNSPESPVRGIQKMSRVNTSPAERKQTFLGEKISQQKKSLRKFNNTITNISVNLGGTGSKAAHKSYINEATGGMNRTDDADRKAELLCGTNSKVGGKNLNLSWNNSTVSNTHNAFSCTANKIKNLASGNKKDAPPNSHKKDLAKELTLGMASGSGKKNSFLNKTLTPDLNPTTIATMALGSRKNSTRMPTASLLTANLQQSTNKIRWYPLSPLKNILGTGPHLISQIFPRSLSLGPCWAREASRWFTKR